jgi:MFS family permease
MGLVDSLSGLIIGLGLFFLAFNFLEASLPALVSRLCSGENRGTAMGVYSTSQFSGAFLGGAFSGLILQFGTYPWVFMCLTLLSVIWLIMIRRMSVVIE